MDTELLRTFLEVSKTRHFGRASENLYLTQSAVSFRIRQLENLVGVALFSRQRNNIMLTPAGERLLPYAETILTSWQMALQDVGVATAQRLQLSVGATSNIWDSCLQPMLPRIAQRFSGLALRTEVSTQIALTRALLEGHLDLIVLFDPPKVSEITTVQVGAISLRLISHQPQAHIDAIDQLGYIFLDWGTAFNFQHARLFPKPIAPILHTGQSLIALEFLLNHGGAAFLPDNLVSAYIEAGKLHQVEGVPPLERKVFAAYLSDTERSDAIVPIIDLFRDTVDCPGVSYHGN